MQSNEDIYQEICSEENLLLAWIKARRWKTKRRYVKRFQRNLKNNLLKLREELLNKTYQPNKLKTFILRDPKTRKISKSAFRDRVVHNALCNIIAPILEKSFIYDSYANFIGKGTLKAVERFDQFKRKVSKNNTRECFVLKADIKHYFQEVNHKILINIIKRRISDEKVIWLIKTILNNSNSSFAPPPPYGMPLGNLTSQFFANVYLNELDQFVKHKLRAKYYIRYVDDFVIMHESKEQLEIWKQEIDTFLKEKLKLELHPNKSHVLKLSCGINFLGFRIFFYHKLLRKSNLIRFDRKFNQLKIMYKEEMVTREEVLDSLEGWLAYASHANCYKYKKHLVKQFNKEFPFEEYKEVFNKKFLNFLKKVDESKLEFSVQKTLLMFSKGLSIKEIAIKRGVKEATVWGHLSNLIEHKQISVRNVLSEEKISKIIKKIYSSKDRLRDIKKELNDSSITFDEIACVMASIKSRKEFLNKKCPRKPN